LLIRPESAPEGATNLSAFSEALEARSSTAQGESARAACDETLGREWVLKESPEGARQRFCVALAGLFFHSSIITQGFGCFAAFALGFAVPRFQRFALIFPGLKRRTSGNKFR
jgi:hypothetical protein